MVILEKIYFSCPKNAENGVWKKFLILSTYPKIFHSTFYYFITIPIKSLLHPQNGYVLKFVAPIFWCLYRRASVKGLKIICGPSRSASASACRSRPSGRFELVAKFTQKGRKWPKKGEKCSLVVWFSFLVVFGVVIKTGRISSRLGEF